MGGKLGSGETDVEKAEGRRWNVAEYLATPRFPRAVA